nr:phage tail protein [Providencia alcalifaciens]
MAKNEFLPFGIAEGANVLSNQEYERLAARFNGFVSGVAKSKELNTVWRQSSVMSSALAQFIVDSDNKDLLDNGDVASVKNRLVSAIKQTISGVGYVTTAAMNLELNKKFDKANISGVKGNDNDKAPSLNLFTTEIGKLQPKGNYQPAGDYATTQALNDGLNKKFDKTGGNVDGLISAKNEVAVTTNNSMMSMKTLDSVRGPHFVSKIENGAYRTHDLQDKSGVLMHLGDYGWGGVGACEDLTEQQVENKFKTGVTQVWRNQSNSTKYGPQFAASIYAKAYDTFLNISMGHSNGNITATSGVSGNSADTFKIANLYSDLNTSTDRNGCLRTSANHELSDYPVGSPIAWSQSSPPAGYLVCNGQSFNKTTYPLLAKAYPSGSLPDLRGEFIRGLDAGRNIDTGRTALSSQSDAIRNITGKTGEMLTGGEGSAVYEGAFAGGLNGGNVASSPSGSRMQKSTFDASRVVPTANENRPRNIAFLYIVRAA